MGIEINLLKNYPQTKRDVKARGAEKTEQDRLIARRFDKDFFDGDRKNGYGGFNYHPRFWENVVPTFQEQYNLTNQSAILDVGCAKGFMLYDFSRLIPGIKIAGVDISSYAIENAYEPIKEHLKVANATDLPYNDKSFDLAISITTIHNLEEDECALALKELMRVSRKNAFVTLDAYTNNEEKEAMYAWNLTAKTIKHVDDWKVFFSKVGYTGDYYWFMP